MKLLALHRWQVFLASLFTALIWVFVAGQASAEFKDEASVKAAYLYNFSKYVRFPAKESHEPLVIAVVGENPFGRLVQQMRGKKVQGRPLSVLEVSTVEQIDHADIVYISRSEERRLNRLLRYFDEKPTLTVSSIEGFADRGGMLELVANEGRIEFEVNLKRVRHKQMDLPYQLLELARRVVE